MKKKFFCLCFAILSIIIQLPANENLREVEKKLTQIAEQTFPSVVVITTKKKLETIDNPWNMFFDSPYFERFRKKLPRQPKFEEPVIQGAGSGFIVDEEGFIITNNHVIDGNNEIIVRLNDKSEYSAEIVGADPKTDIAVLKIKAGKKLPFLRFANSDEVKVGQFCIAIGAPFMLDYTMTFGIVSQKGRQVGLNFYENYIQTGAAINMGNSGGPLVNLDGELIGVNDFIVSANSFAPGNVGLGFAIPSNMVKKVYEEIRKHGKVIRPWVGIGMEELSSKQKSDLNIESGVLIKEVYNEHPADKAGIEPGDIILKVAGKKVNSPKDVQNIVLEFSPGENIEFTIMRDKKVMNITVKAEKQADDIASVLRGGKEEGEDSGFGIKFAEENGEIIVSEVEQGSEAEMIGIEPGMVVISINGKKVKSLSDVEKSLKERKNELSIVVSDGIFKKIFTIKKK
ncbi:MAG TPA: trypsin-like peptidase domain-containing protein [Victivallales bacterium]|nr:trypsin-like peptidase domain-containing protein [Victivallales bacterium]